MNFPKEKLKEIYLSLPEVIANTITSEKTFGFLSDLASENNFSVGQLDKMHASLGYRLLGLITEKDFPKILQEDLGIDENLSNKIVDKLNRGVILKIPANTLQQQERVATEALQEKTVQKKDGGHLPQIPPEDLPAIIPGEKVHDTNTAEETRSKRQETNNNRVPVNLPTDNNVPKTTSFPEEVRPVITSTPTIKTRPGGDEEEVVERPAISNKQKAQKPTNNHYPAGQDPYREPIE